MPQRQQTQGDFGLRPTKVTQGITDVYHAPSIPKPSVEGLEAIANLSKTAMGLIVEQDKLEQKNAALEAQATYRRGVVDRASEAEKRRLTKEQIAAEKAQRESGLAFGEDHPFADVAADSPESYMIGHSEGRGNALRRMFRSAEQSSWDTASTADTGLLRDFEARATHHDEALTAFLEEHGIDGIARESFLRGASEHRFDLLGKHDTVAMGANKDDFLAIGQDMTLNAIDSLEEIAEELSDDDNVIDAIIAGDVEGVDSERRNFLTIEEKREELMLERTAPIAAELQQHLQTAYAMGDSVLKEAVASISEDLIEEMKSGNNPILARIVLESLRTGTGDFAARPDVVSALRSNEQAINDNINRVSITTEDRLGIWKAVRFLPPSTTLAQVEKLERSILDSSLKEEKKTELIKTLYTQYASIEETRGKGIIAGNATAHIIGGGVSVREASQASGITEPRLNASAEEELQRRGHIQNEDGTMTFSPEQFARNVAESTRVEVLPETAEDIDDLIGNLAATGGEFQGSLPKARELVSTYKELRLLIPNRINSLLALTPQQVDTMDLLVNKIEVQGLAFEDAVNSMPPNVSFSGVSVPTTESVTSALESRYDGWGWDDNAHKFYDDERVEDNEAFVRMIQNETVAYMYDHSISDPANALEYVVKNITEQGYIAVDGIIVKLPTGQSHEEKTVAKEFRDINKEVKKQAFEQMQEDKKTYDALYAKEYERWQVEEWEGKPLDTMKGYISDAALNQMEMEGLEFFDAQRDAKVVAMDLFREKYGYMPMHLDDDLLGIDDWEDMPISIASTTAIGVAPMYEMVDAEGRDVAWGPRKFTQKYSVSGLYDFTDAFAEDRNAVIAERTAAAIAKKDEALNLTSQPEAKPTAQQVRQAKDASAREDKDMIVRAWQQSEYEKTGKTPKYSDYPN